MSDTFFNNFFPTQSSDRDSQNRPQVLNDGDSVTKSRTSSQVGKTSRRRTCCSSHTSLKVIGISYSTWTTMTVILAILTLFICTTQTRADTGVRMRLCGVMIGRALRSVCGQRGTYSPSKRSISDSHDDLHSNLSHQSDDNDDLQRLLFQSNPFDPFMHPSVSKRARNGMCSAILRYQSDSIVAQCCCRMCTASYLELYCDHEEEERPKNGRKRSKSETIKAVKEIKVTDKPSIQPTTQYDDPSAKLRKVKDLISRLYGLFTKKLATQ